MLRTQVQFTETQYRRLRQLAHERGMSISAVVRQSVEQFLDSETYETEALYSRAAEVVGRFGDKDGRDDLAAEHDAYLEDAYR